jgi:hypothetical protein
MIFDKREVLRRKVRAETRLQKVAILSYTRRSDDPIPHEMFHILPKAYARTFAKEERQRQRKRPDSHRHQRERKLESVAPHSLAGQRQ